MPPTTRTVATVCRTAMVAVLLAVLAPACAAPSATERPSAAATTTLAVPPGALDTAQHSLAFAEQQLAAEVGRIAPGAYPAETVPATGAWATTDSDDWRCGFFPAMLWQMYGRTRDPVWMSRAQDWQAPLEPTKSDDGTHDIGFILLPTYGHGYELTGNDAFRQVALTAAATLSTRFGTTVGAIRSWDDVEDRTQFRVIVDNMMNLELLFWGAQHGGDARWAAIARSHATRTAEEFVRPDGSTFHVVNFDQTTGAVLAKGTAQGFSDTSTWARGQAWAVYGFTMAYRYTQDPRFLDTARSVAGYWIQHLPADKVPYWDFALPSTANEPRDTSAAAIAAAGLLELSQHETDPARKANYFGTAQDMILALSGPDYQAEGTKNQAILLRGTQNKPGGNFDTGLVVGDYYWIEALSRYEQVASGRPAVPGAAPPAAPTR